MITGADQLLKPGQLFAGKYRIERYLAQGGHGAVFVAEQLSTEAPVAIKVLWPHMQTPDLVARFELEAKVAGRVRSDFIVKMLDAGSDEETGLLFLVMELLEGQSLADYVKERGALEFVEAATYLVQVAHGLDKAHRYVKKDGTPQPIIHRDLKPGNLFLCFREDGQPMVKILDFGIAKLVSESVAMSQDIKATPLFMASEQASGDPISPRTDVWAFGLIAFFLLTGRYYWRGGAESISTIFAEVLHNPIVPPSERAREFGLTPSWPEPFDAWFLRCVNRDPSARFATAGDAASALAESLLGDAWAATLPSGMRFDSMPQSGPLSTTYPSAVPGGATGPSTTAAAAAKTASAEPPARPAMRFVVLGVIVLAGLTFFGLRNNLEQTVMDSRPHPSTASNGSTAPPLESARALVPKQPTVRSLTSSDPPSVPPAASSAAPPSPPDAPIGQRVPTKTPVFRQPIETLKAPGGAAEMERKANEKGVGAPVSSSPIYTER